MTRRVTTPVRSRRAARQPSATANVELVDGPVLIGLFGDYCRMPQRIDTANILRVAS